VSALLRIVRAEFTKALTLRSVCVALVLAASVPPALALLSGLALDPRIPAAARMPIEAHGFEPAGFGQPIVILIAALLAGTEYSGAQLRTTFLAGPVRSRVFAAKMIVVAALSAAVAVIAIPAAVLLAHAALGDEGLRIDEFTSGMAWNLIGVAVNYTLIGVLTASVTLLARTIILPLVLLVPLVLGVTISLIGALPALKFMPDLAGLQLLTPYPGVGLLEPVTGAILMAGWAVLIGGVAWLAFVRRDVGGG
jgi:ABC-2 type transport system permease protein